MLETNIWDWKETEFCGDFTVSNPNEFYVIRCQKATHAHKQCTGFKATSETLTLELRRNLRTTHVCKFIFRRLTVTRAILNALESAFVDVMECSVFQTLKFDKCAIDDEILEKPTILDRYRIAKHIYFYVQFDDYTRLTPLIHKKAVQLADEIATFHLEPIELFNFAFGINYKMRQENHNFCGLAVRYVPVDDYRLETVFGSLLNIMDKDASDNSFLAGCPFFECVIRVEVWSLSYSEVNKNLPIFEILTLYSTIYDYDGPSDSDYTWYHEFRPNSPKALSVIEAYAFPDISTKFRAVLHVWWVYIADEDDYSFLRCDVLLQNKQVNNYPRIFL
ncbi:hypothetical protein Ddc_15373 [Ditylenchus destructor]|nr:hypothetical protein Ddc_15373 [Ditylenchus destructor]